MSARKYWKMNVPSVSLIVPCRNEKDSIEPCIQSLLAQDLPEGSFEIIVVDALSNDGTREILTRLAAEHGCLHLVDDPGRSVPMGLNTAVRAARGRIIVRIDAHTQYAPDYVSQCLAVLQETGADNVGGPWVAQGTGYIGRAVAAAFQSPFAVGWARGHNQHYTGPVDTVYLGCWPCEVFDRIGFFDEALVRNEDDEFNLRLSRAGGLIWQSPRIKSWYHPRTSLRSLWRQYAQYGYWKVRVIQKHCSPASVRHLVPAAFVLTMLTLPIVALFWPWAWWIWGALGMLYIVGNLAASVDAARRSGLALFPVLPAVFACYHLGYGYGFLRGIWDFILLRRIPAGSMSTLTR
jgi:glycosyltransferase involved in cell wall biosynthesis